MKRAKNNQNLQLNNKGFTLVEVLVAAIIMAIITIPVLHAFITSANTTAKSTMKMYATNAAEAMMELIKSSSAAELALEYGGLSAPNVVGEKSTSADPDAYQFTVSATNPAFDDSINTAISKGLKVDVTLDPSIYQNANAINLPELDSVSSEYSAIYCMSQDLDEDTYDYYAKKNEEYRKLYSDADLWNRFDFEKYLKREIRVDINSSGTVTGPDGTVVPKVTVDVTVTYLLWHVDNIKVIDPINEKRVVVSRQLFNNAASGNPLKSIFLFYDARYDAAPQNGDIIIVHNAGNIEADLYVVAQNTNVAEDWLKYRTKGGAGKAGLILQMYQDEITDPKTGLSVQPLTLRTNLIEDSLVSYMSATDVVPLQCFITLGKKTQDPEGINDTFTSDIYKKIVDKKGDFEKKEYTKKLRAATIDGKSLDPSVLDKRIYYAKVAVDYTDSTSKWPARIEFEGTTTE